MIKKNLSGYKNKYLHYRNIHSLFLHQKYLSIFHFFLHFHLFIKYKISTSHHIIFILFRAAIKKCALC